MKSANKNANKDHAHPNNSCSFISLGLEGGETLRDLADAVQTDEHARHLPTKYFRLYMLGLGRLID